MKNRPVLPARIAGLQGQTGAQFAEPNSFGVQETEHASIFQACSVVVF
jgi:hypothetical protein